MKLKELTKLGWRSSLKLSALTAMLAVVSSCGGGGGGGGSSTTVTDSASVISYPYETVFGDVCLNSKPTPGCTFSRSTDKRITVTADPDYNRSGYGSDDLWYVKFDSSGQAKVYNDLGSFQYNANVNDFAGYIGGTTIGVGTTGLFWENVSNKTYWFGDTGILYNTDTSSSKYGQAINNKNAKNATDVNSKALASEANKSLIKAGAEKLVKQYGLSQSKAVAVASALNSWAVMGAERGKITAGDMDKTFKTVFGVQFNDALSAVNAFKNGDASAEEKMRDLTNRSANQLGLKPEQAKDFIKGMYKGAIEDMGYSVDDINW